MVSSKKTGKHIRKLMADHGMSVRELQERIGLESPQAIYKWMHGRSLPTLENLVMLSRILGVNVEEILVWEEEAGPACGLTTEWSQENGGFEYDRQKKRQASGKFRETSRADKIGAGESRADENGTETNRADEIWMEESLTDESLADESLADESLADESSADGNRTADSKPTANRQHFVRSASGYLRKLLLRSGKRIGSGRCDSQKETMEERQAKHNEAGRKRTIGTYLIADCNKIS